MRLEHRHVGEVRAEAQGRRLSGTVLVYGDRSPSHNEVFTRGALVLAPTVPVNIGHRRFEAIGWYPNGGVSLRDDGKALRMTAQVPEIPAGDAALEMVRSGRATGLSLEFQAQRERQESGNRLVDQALVVGVGIVANPSYQKSHVEARRRSGRTMRADFPTGTRLECRCADGDCTSAMFETDVLQRAFDRAFEQRKMIAVFEDYSRPLASVGRGTIRRVGATAVAIDLPQGDAGDAAVDASSSVGVIVRPLPDRDTAVTEMVEQDGEQVLVYREVDVRALVVTPTDAREGWPEAVIEDDPAEAASASSPRRGPRRYGRWQR